MQTDYECSQKGCSSPRFVLPESYVVDEKDFAESGIEYFNRKRYLAYCKDRTCCSSFEYFLCA